MQTLKINGEPHEPSARGKKNNCFGSWEPVPVVSEEYRLLPNCQKSFHNPICYS